MIGLASMVFCIILLSGTPVPKVKSTAHAEIVSVLFVGNSLTYINDLPGKVSSLLQKKSGTIEIDAKMLAKANYALEDHWNDGELQNLLNTRHFDYVIVQQGPSSQADGRAMLLEYGKKIKELCDARQTRLAFFMVWPAKYNRHMFDGVIKNYTDAASLTGSLLCPVGQVWKKHFEETGDFSYYGPDDFHPSEKGTIAAAHIIVKSIFGFE